jgi:hypothetical protein
MNHLYIHATSVPPCSSKIKTHRPTMKHPFGHDFYHYWKWLSCNQLVLISLYFYSSHCQRVYSISLYSHYGKSTICRHFWLPSKQHAEKEVCSEIHQKHHNSLQNHHTHPLQPSTIVKMAGRCHENEGMICKNPSLLLFCASCLGIGVALGGPHGPST